MAGSGSDGEETTTASDAAPPSAGARDDEARLEGDETRGGGPGKAARVTIAAIVVAALSLVAVTTPQPRAGQPPGASPSGMVAGARSTPIDPASPSAPGPSVGTTPSPSSPEAAETPELAGALRGTYGTGMAADSKANLPVGPWGRISHRFVASTSAEVVGVRFSQRGGPDGYSGGTGGTIRVSIQADEGGVPSGSAVTELFFEPGNPSDDWATFDRHDFPSPAALDEGGTYHVVYENVDPAPLDNYISVNDLYVYDPATLSRPPGLGAEFAVLDEEDGEWDVQSRYTPVVDIVHADGTHDGQGYIEALVDESAFAVGADLQTRETFIVSGADRLVGSVSVRVRRTFGESPLTIRLETVDRTTLESLSIPAEQIRVGVPGDFDDDASEVWVTAPFAQQQTLAAGAGYNLVLSTAADTEYSTIPLREGTVEGLESYRFTDGVAQQTYDGGEVWIDVFDLAPADLQFFFE